MVRRLIHQTDEHVFKTGADFLPFMVRSTDGGERRLEGGGVASAHVERGAEGDDLIDAGPAAELFGEGEQAGAVDGPRHEAGAGEDFPERAVGEEIAVGELGKAVAALGHVQVVGGDENGDAVVGEAVEFVPKFPTGLRVDAGGGLVEQVELGRVDEAGGEGEARFPAAGEFAGELVAAVGEAEGFEAGADGGGAVGDGVKAGDEIEVFADAEVFVVTELLGHVADVALDVGLLGASIVAEAGAGVGREEAAEQADRGGLAAAVGAEEAVAFPASGGDVGRLAGMQVAGGGGVGAGGFDEEHELGAVVENGRGEFGLG